MGPQSVIYLETFAKLLFFETQIAIFVGISKKIAIFTESATFPGKSSNLLFLL